MNISFLIPEHAASNMFCAILYSEETLIWLSPRHQLLIHNVLLVLKTFYTTASIIPINQASLSQQNARKSAVLRSHKNTNNNDNWENIDQNL